MKLYQNTEGMSEAIRESGCGLMCALELASRRSEGFSTPEEVNVFKSECVKQKIIDDDCFIKSWDKLFGALGASASCRYVKDVAYRPKEDEELIYKGLLGTIEHFYTPTYDPYYPESKTKRYGTIKEVLVVKFKTAPVAVTEEA